jgi:uncharacterized membrane protein
MRTQKSSATAVDQPEATEAKGELSSPSKENLEVLANFHEREDAAISGIQLVIERISTFFGSPWYFAFCVIFIIAWVFINLWGVHAGWPHVDAPPFPWLQGIVSSNALLLTVAVLIRQNRMARLAEHRSHLDLQINLLTEQKATKILQIVDELQRELIALRGHPDTQMEEMTKPADANALLHAIKKQTGDR